MRLKRVKKFSIMALMLLLFSNSVSYLNIFENNKNIKDKSHSLNSEKNAMKDLGTCKSTLSFLISGEE